jgi:hypothetical protein
LLFVAKDIGPDRLEYPKENLKYSRQAPRKSKDPKDVCPRKNEQSYHIKEEANEQNIFRIQFRQ